ncbi:MAG: DNA methyltransferase [Verrucomicrobiota bacterium]
MTIPEFIAKWRKVELKERSAAQEHFLDLCSVFEHPTPAAADPTGENYCFEKGAAKHEGGDGFADVWKRGFFGIEYKGKHKDLAAAYNQLLRYRNALESPPLLVVCDLDRIIVHTNFTGTVSATHEIPLENLGDARNVAILRAVFHNPEALHPVRTSVAVTQDAARQFAEIADALRKRGLDPAAVAHFLDRVVFCLFAEDTRLLPEMVFSRIIKNSRGDPARFARMLGQLFDTMATGGDFGLEPIRHFNGSLFEDKTVLDLTADEMRRIAAAANLDWSAVDPSIFGTLFERGLDPAKRSQLGAHFTGREDIELVVDAVMMTVLRREWDECRVTMDCLLATGRKTPACAAAAGRPAAAAAPAKPMNAAAMKKAQGESASILHRFLDRLQRVRVLDPACGSGNFLYVALLRLKDLEKEAILYGNDNGLGSFLPMVGPWQLFGLEINSYAHDLAQMTVWIGWLQWIRVNGFGFPADPILRPLSENIRLMDAIVSDTGEPEWPAVDFIIGNPPFLGDKLMRREMGDDYVERVRSLYQDRLPGQSDLCCYWFEKARAHIAAGKCKRAGLLATQGIRGGANREVLKRIKETGGIFWAESDRPWLLNGANVHVSMVGFDNGSETMRTLDGQAVGTINSNLSASEADITQAIVLQSNCGLCFQGPVKVGKFEIADRLAIEMLQTPCPHGKPNSDVIFPWVNGIDLTRLPQRCWIIDFAQMTEAEASLHEAPFAYVERHVKPARDSNADRQRRENWWRLGRSGGDWKSATEGMHNTIFTPRVSKHRVFVWSAGTTLPDSAVVGFARSDDYFFGVLHCRFHEVWALRMGTRLETRPRYTPTTCFETFPFPFADDTAKDDPLHFVASLRAAHYHFGQENVVCEDPPPATPREHRAAIAAAAKELNELREAWLNPPEWTREEVTEFPGTLGGPWDRFIDPATVTDRGAFKVGTVRYPRLVARDAACAARLKERTLTKLYNVRPAWLAACHAKLDTAVAAAYGWPADLTDEAILENLLALNQAASDVPSAMLDKLINPHT